MGCKCGRDYLFTENEIIKAEPINKKKNMRTKNLTYNINNNNSVSYSNKNDILLNNNSSNSIPYINYNNFNNFDKKSEISYAQKNNEESVSYYNMNGSQISSLDFPQKIEEDNKKNDYPQKVISLINKIRSDPVAYSNIVEESIKNIKTTKNNQIIYYNIVKVALYRGEQAFRDAINELKNTEPMLPLRFNPQLCIPLPENEQELKEQNFLKNQVEKMKEKDCKIEIYFKDLIKIPEVSVLLMIVDDNSKLTSKKRNTLLNNEFKYIGVNCKFIGKNFVAHFSFSR